MLAWNQSDNSRLPGLPLQLMRCPDERQLQCPYLKIAVRRHSVALSSYRFPNFAPFSGVSQILRSRLGLFSCPRPSLHVLSVVTASAQSHLRTSTPRLRAVCHSLLRPFRAATL